MNREDIEKLVGGYATGTLTPQEQQALFAAALDDQELFDTLAREQSLRDLLRDPAARAQILAAADSPRPRWRQLAEWLRRPVVVVPVMAVAVAIGIVVVRQNVKPPKPVTVAVVQAPPTVVETPAPKPPEPAAEVKPPARREAAPVRRTLPAPAAPAAQPPPLTAAAPALSSVPALQSQGALQQLDQAAQQNRETLMQAPKVAVTAQEALVKVADSAAPADAITLFYGAAAGAQFSAGGFLDKGAVPAGKREAGAPAGQAEQKDRALQVQQRAAPSAATGFAPAAAIKKQISPANLGVQYRLLRELEGGGYADVGPDETLAAGTVLKLQIQPNNDGYVEVIESGPDDARVELVSRRVEGWTLFEAPVRLATAARKELRVWFSRRPQGALGGSLPNVVQTTADTKSGAGKANQQHWTYVVSKSTDLTSQVAFTITLNPK